MKYILFIILIWIFIEDFNKRTVPMFCFLLLLSAVVFIRYQNFNLYTILFDTGLNMIYIIIIFTLGLLYIKLRHHDVVQKYIGLGDIMLMACLAFWFDPVMFMVFTVFSFITSLLLHCLFVYINQKYKQISQIPLAGFQSLCFVAVLIMPELN